MSSNCPCDQIVFPPGLSIPPALNSLSRQIAMFPDYRRALLAAIPSEVPLAGWRARDNADYGVMLLEIWAVLADMVSFYDEVIADELYLRTARLRPSVRKLTGLLGYVPRPGSSSSVTLAGLADGRTPVTVPPQTAFRSGAFSGNPPQVFETETQASIHPAFNSWTLRGVKPPAFPVGAGALNTLLAVAGTVSVKKSDIVVLTAGSFARVLVVDSVGNYAGADGTAYAQIAFTTAIGIPDGTTVAGTRLMRPTASAGLWKRAGTSPYSTSSGHTLLLLDGLVRQILPQQYVLVGRGTDLRWFQVQSVSEVDTVVVPSATINITDGSGTTVVNKVVTPAVSVPATQIELNALLAAVNQRIVEMPIQWSVLNLDVSVHYGMVDAAQITVEAKPSLAATDPLQIQGRAALPPGITPPGAFLMQDADDRGVSISGSLDFSSGLFSLAQGSAWSGNLTAPVTVYGNLLNATRGETVPPEFIGTGDATQEHQTFTLNKKPLSYTPSPTAGNLTGVASTLSIYVDGVKWSETPTFYGVDGGAPLYTVRQDDDGNTLVTMARLRTGSSVVAYYRYGAGAAVPPPGSVTQLAKPVTGLRSVRDPLGAAGGADAEAAESIRQFAPQSALLLGRAISVPDLEAAASIQPGVRAASAEWAWNDDAQTPVIQIYYIGDSQLQKQIGQTLRGLTDGVTPVRVDAALAVTRRLTLDIEIDDRYLEDNVLAAVRQSLAEPAKGLLTPEQLGVNRPLFRSVIFETVLAVPGALAVRSFSISGFRLLFLFATAYGFQPGAGRYFDFQTGGIVLNGRSQ